MPYNGVGLFQRIYSWVADAAVPLNIDATRMDTDTNDIASGLSNCITRDGQSPWTANLPAGSFKITGLGNGNSNADSVNYGQVFNDPVFNSPRATASPNVGDNSTLLATTAFAQQLAYSAALPGQAMGILQSDGTIANFTKNLFFGLNFSKAPSVASSASPDIWSGNGNTMHITGSIGINGFSNAPQPGAYRWLIFDNILTLTNSANMVIIGGSNYVTSVNDIALVFADTTTKFYVIIFPSDGLSTKATPYLYVRDEDVSGTGSQIPISSDITQTRRLTTVVSNSITGSSLASNTITLPAGTYRVLARAPGSSTGQQKIFLYNVTDATYTLVGASTMAAGAAGFTTIDAPLRGEFTISAQKNFTIRHWITTASTNGLGVPAGISGQPEIYTEVEIWKIY